MKIAILYDVAFPFSIGGGEKINWELARRLAARGHEVAIVTSKMWDGPDTIERYGVRHVGVCRWLAATNNLGNRSGLQPFLFAGRVFSFLCRNRFDVVACNAFPYLSCLAAKAAGLFVRAPLVITWYEARGLRAWVRYAGIGYGPFAAALERITARLTRHHTTISDWTAARMTATLRIPRDRIAVVPCGVDLAAVAGNAPTPPKEKTILYVGRLVRHKRVDLLIDAFADVAAAFPDYTLRIVGPGVEKPALQAQAQARGLGTRAQFDDTLVGEPLCDAFRKAALFVLPSEQEGFGMVLIEAMAAGTPVIARSAELSAATSLVDAGQNGLLFETRAELADALRETLTNTGLRARLAAAGRETARHYDWDAAIVPQLEAYLNAVRQEGTRR